MTIKEYFQHLSDIATMMKNHSSEIHHIKSVILLARDNGNRVFIIGNGGSASTADHFTADITKVMGATCVNLMSTATITAVANDVKYEQIFAYQLNRHAYPRDLLIAISTSGNSKNIIEAVNYAKSNMMTVVTITAFDGGELVNMGNINVHVDTDVIEVAEDIHSAILHSVVKSHKAHNHEKQP